MKRRQRKVKQLVLLGLSASLFFQPILAVATAIPTEVSESESEVNLDLLKMPELPVVNQQPIESPEVEEPTFHFQKQQLSGQIEESLSLEIKASVVTKTFELDLPNAATVVVEELPPGITVKSTSNKWQVTSQQVRSTFRIPVSFDASGTFAVATADDEMEVVIEASEPEELPEDVTSDDGGQEEEHSSDVEPTENDITEIGDVDSVATEQIVLPTAEFIGEERPVNTFADLQAAINDSAVAIISLTNNIEMNSILDINRSLMIKGNGYKIDIIGTTSSFRLQNVASASTFRLENISIAKVGTSQIAVIREIEDGNWTIELEDVSETVSRLGTANLQLINTPDSKVHFTGGVSTLNHATATWTYIIAKELALSNQAQVNIQRGNAANPIWTSNAGTEKPKLSLTGNSQLKIDCPSIANNANTLYLQGINPTVTVDDSHLEIVTGNSSSVASDSARNTVALVGNDPRLTIQAGGKIEINTLGTKRGIHMAGTNPQVEVRQGNLEIKTENGMGLNLAASTGTNSQAITEDSLLEFTSVGGSGIAIVGSAPTLNFNNTQATFTSTDNSQAILLDGDNASMVLDNHSDVKVANSGSSIIENIQIGNNRSSPSLRLSEQSALTIETTSSFMLATTTDNNALHLRGDYPSLTVQQGATIDIHVISGYRRGVYLQGTEPKLDVESQASLITKTNFDGINLSGDFPEAKIKGTVSASIELTASIAVRSFCLIGSRPKLMLESGQLFILNNLAITSASGIELLGDDALFEASSEAEINVNTRVARGILISGDTPKLKLSNTLATIQSVSGTALDVSGSNSQFHLVEADLSTNTGSGTAISLSGINPTFSTTNSELSMVSTTGTNLLMSGGGSPKFTMNRGFLEGTTTTGRNMDLRGTQPQVQIDQGEVTLETQSGLRIRLEGDEPLLELQDSQLNLESTERMASGNFAINLLGTAPKLVLRGSELKIDESNQQHRPIVLNGSDATISVLEQSKLIVTVESNGDASNSDVIQIGNGAGEAKMIVTEQSEVSIISSTTTGIRINGENTQVRLESNVNFRIETTGIRQALVMSGDTINCFIEESQLEIVTDGGSGIALSGNAPKFHLVESDLSISTISGVAMSLSGENAKFQAESSEISLHTETGTQIDLAGNNSCVEIQGTVLEGNTVGGSGIYLVGNSPELIISDSEMILSTENGTRQSILLEGDYALFDVSSQSQVTINSEGMSNIENIAIGKTQASLDVTVQPTLRLTEESVIDITTVGGQLPAGFSSLGASFYVSGSEASVEILDSFLNIDITQENLRGFVVDGSDFQLTVSNSQLFLDLARAGGNDFSDSDALTFSGLSMNEQQQVTIEDSSEIIAPRGVINLRNQGETVVSNSIIQGQRMRVESSRLLVEEQSRIDLVTTPENRHTNAINLEGDGLLTALAGFAQVIHITSESVVNIHRNDRYERPAFSGGFPGESKVIVEDSGKLFVVNEGSGRNNDSFQSGANSAVTFNSGDNNHFIVRGEGSMIVLDAKHGAAISNSVMNTNGTIISNYSMNIEVSDRAHFEASANTLSVIGAVINVSDLTITFDNPEYLDFRSHQLSFNGRLFSCNSNSIFTGTNSSLALWRNNDVLEGDPHISVNNIDYEFSGRDLQTLTYSSEPEMLNQEMFSGGSLANYRRISSNNKRWAIADELRVPTTADKKIHGHVSIPEGFDGLRSAWDNEVEVVVELQRGNQIEEFVTYTKGYENDYPSLSIYGEEPRPGLFEIQLDDYLQVGDQIRIKEVSLVSGESAGESVVETGSVGVFPIQPPTPALFESDKITSEATSVRGYTDNPEAIVTAVVNQQASDGTFTQSPLDDSLITMAGQGYFDIDLTSLTLFEGDYLQVFLRDKNGAAADFGVTNPPETNNGIGNINPVEDMVFRDGAFPKATILTVLEMGPLPPVDPLNPVEEVDPENPSEPIHEGVLSIDFVSQFRFGEVAISAQKKDYPALPQRLLNGDGTISEEERPNYVQISNRQASAINWRLSATLQDEGFLNQNDEELRGAQIALGNQQLASTQTDVDSRISIIHNDRAVLLPGVKTDLVKTIDEENQGTWIYRFGNQETAGSSVLLQVPQSANPKTDTYRATISWEISIVPDH
jgi:hypothetical protein